MSYQRGDTYIWAGGDGRVHVWVADGDDGWRDSIWAAGEDGRRHSGREHASGVGVPETNMDELVVMRFAELLQDGELSAAIDRAVEHHTGNVGCIALARRAAQLKGLLDQPWHRT